MAATSKKIQVGIVDDHNLLRKALAKLISSFENYAVLFEGDSGKELKARITQSVIPDIVLLDVNMPDMDGYETVRWLNKNYPQVKVLALSMFSDETTIIRMLRLGAKGYILKNIEPEELKEALDSIMKKDFYLSEYISGKIISGLHKDLGNPDEQVALSDKEKEFLRLVCSELTYKDIADKMYISHRTVDNYRNVLFEKLKVKSRVGLVMYAIKNGIAET
ncbi:MAG: response regulator transcription factor [Bacteroidota bacterium]|nr:response regulator transcription factor [Bacteroidota bacterium]MDP4254819.1 response regulator transcription factor [Bacteroidota bacterium]MDP4258354.1 response regulator transcription factor [Bacteroidota bacterium]